MKFCLECKSILSLSKPKEQKFCNRSCAGRYNGRKFPKRKPLPNKFCKCGKRKRAASKVCVACTKVPKAERLKRRNTYQRGYYRDRQAILISEMGGCCKVCGKLEKLNFHHINPEDKGFDVSAKISNKRMEQLLEELKKCELLCTGCHRWAHVIMRNAPSTGRGGESSKFA